MSENATTFSFFKGGEDILSSKEGEAFNWEEAASTVRGQLSNAMNARNVAFLLGSGCSSYYSDDQQVGIPTMAPMAKTFLDEVGANEKSCFVTKEERDKLKKGLGLDIAPCVREVVRCSTFLYFSGGRDRTLTWDTHRNADLRC